MFSMVAFRALEANGFLSRALSTEFRVLRMPQLSPTTKSAVIEAWYVEEGSRVSSYDLALRVSTHELTENKVENEAMSRTNLDVEVIEDGMVVKILVNADHLGQVQVPVDTPLAILCDDDLSEVERENLDTKVILSNDVNNALWQAYLVDEGDACGTCG